MKKSIKVTFDIVLIFFIIVGFKGGIRDVVKANNMLVGILDDQVLAILLGHDLINDATNNAPAIVQRQVDLSGEFSGFELLRAQDHVPGRVLHVQAGDVTEFEDV